MDVHNFMAVLDKALGHVADRLSCVQKHFQNLSYRDSFIGLAFFMPQVTLSISYRVSVFFANSCLRFVSRYRRLSPK
jgi:hypothetical protein